jgi:3-hydroxyacyl-CoA dehydrogenase/enoyl-CoA hydratase/carnithine racemase
MQTDYQTIQITMDEGVAVFRLDNPPVNQLSATLREEMAAAFDAAARDPAVQAVVVTGTGSNFMAGADITEIQHAVEVEPLCTKVLAFDEFYNRIENSPKAVVAAINGPALGGGLELAMACHYRIAARGIVVGQPEVQLGLIPGAGGTQRLPRLCGLADALTLITTGAPVSADVAREKGIVDAVVAPEELVAAAAAAARRFASGEENHAERVTSRRTDRLPSTEEKAAVIAFAKETAAKKARGLMAPFKAIEALEKGLSGDFAADLRLEARLFAECAVSDIAKNLIGIFLNSRGAGRLPRLKGIAPGSVGTVAMVGLGVMGSGIANLLLRNGYRAVLWEVNEDALQRGLQAIRRTFAYPIKKGKMTEADLDRLIGEKAVLTTRLEDVAPADLVIEAVLENMEIKKSVWRQVDAACADHAVFATNTSALPITELATCLKDPSRMLGLHFFNPAERMQLVEIISAGATADEALATAVAFARKIKKIPVVVNDGPGFYVSRQLNALMGECNFMLEEGIPMATIDRALTGLGLPMGPFTLHDLTGIDIGFHVAENFERSFGPRWAVSTLHRRIYQTGCYGRKTGSGYYDYQKAGKPEPNPKVMAVIDAYLKEQNVDVQDAVDPRVLARRMLARAINEAAFMMDEGICDRAPDMDLAMVYGCGYPPHRGGILREADNWGIDKVYKYLQELENRSGIRFKPSKRIQAMAENGRTFYIGG